MRHIRLIIEYDGTEYHGWQSQKAGGTIQDIMREKIFAITGEKAMLTGASRTDSGVHALGQVAAFGTRSGLSPDVIMRALNAKLPADIRILGSEETNSDFHPRYAADRKSYFYILSTSKLRSAFLYKYMWNVKTGLNIHSMREAAHTILGEHDFSSFMGSGCGSKTRVRTVHSLDISRHRTINFMTAHIRGDFIKIRIEANAFLRHMVRNIVGTLVEVGRGNLSPEMLSKILKCRDRTAAGPTAPAQGLFLEKITY